MYCDFGLMYQLTLPNTIWLPLDIRRGLYDMNISDGGSYVCDIILRVPGNLSEPISIADELSVI